VLNKRKNTIFLSLFLFFVAILISTISPKKIIAQDTNAEATEEVEETEDGKDPEKYTLMPLLMNGGELDYESLVKNLTWDQGYEVHCANNTWRIKKSVWGDIEEYFNNNASANWGGTESYNIDFTQARIPLFRGMETSAETIKNSSFEGMFGANYQGSETYENNSAGVAQRLLTNYQQCVVKMTNVDAATKICETVEGVAPNQACALNKSYQLLANPDKGIAAEEFKLSKLKSWFYNLGSQVIDEENTIENICGYITTPDEENYPELDINEINKIAAAIRTIPIDMDNLYRLAFLVLVPEQDPIDGKDQFTFLQSDSQINEKLQAPIFIAFKIPEFATNKSMIAGNVDSLEITKMLLQTEDRNLIDIGRQNDKRESLMFDTMEAQKLPASEKVINCDGLPQCARTEDNLLVNVLVDMINARPPLCEAENLMIPNGTASDSAYTVADIIFNQEDINWEKAGDIFTPASKDIVGYGYQADVNEDYVNRLLSKAAEEFNWSVTINSKESLEKDVGDNVVVNGYLILPVGETVKDANKSMAIFWNENSFLRMINDNVLVDMGGKTGSFAKFYTIKGEDSGFKAGSSESWCDGDTILMVSQDRDGNETTTTICPSENKRATGINFGNTNQNLLFPDFGLGWMIRKIQENIRSTVNTTFNYVKSCQRVEDLFLGRCSGIDEDETIVATCNGEAFNQIIGMPSANNITNNGITYFNDYVVAKGLLTEENMAAYAAAEEATGIPCEIAAGIHLNEGGMQSDKSLFDGGSLHGKDLTADAIAAMQHLVRKIEDLSGDVNNLTYEILVQAIGNYNGPGNNNCSDENTIWSQDGKCPAQFSYEDNPLLAMTIWKIFFVLTMLNLTVAK